MRKPAGYWKTQVPIITQIYNEKGRKAVQAHYGIDRHTFQKVCKRYGIDVRERREFSISNQMSEDNPKYIAWIKRRNEVLLMRW